jgi:malate dehydrogenase (oxaloacetate-decarboxylating)
VLAFPASSAARSTSVRTIDASKELAAARAIAATIADDELSADYIVPSVFNRSVAPAVANAVAGAATTYATSGETGSSGMSVSSARVGAAAT